MRTLILILALFAFIGCDTDEGEEQVDIAVAINFSIRDSEGNDLLNPNNPNSFDESEVKLFYLIDGNLTEVYDGNKHSPRNFTMNEYPPASEYRMTIFVNHSKTEEYPITYIKWNETDTDTIKTEIYRTGSLTEIRKAWFNGELVWESSYNSEPYFELIKYKTTGNKI